MHEHNRQIGPTLSLCHSTVEARKLEHQYPHALEAKHKESYHLCSNLSGIRCSCYCCCCCPRAHDEKDCIRVGSENKKTTNMQANRIPRKTSISRNTADLCDLCNSTLTTIPLAASNMLLLKPTDLRIPREASAGQLYLYYKYT